jgi:hypothetical protein
LVYKLPRKRSQKSSKNLRSREQEKPKVCYEDFRFEKTMPVLLSREAFGIYGNIFPYFFANVAAKYYLNKPLENLEPDDLQTIFDIFCNYELPRANKDNIPFVYSRNDADFAKTCLTLKTSCDMLRKFIEEQRGSLIPIKVYETILPETREHIKLMFPKLEELKRIENIAIASDLLALTVIGAYISLVGKIDDEWHYVFVDLVQEFRVDLESLNRRAKSLMGKLIKGDSSEIAIRVGIASLVADKAFRHLSEWSRAIVYLYHVTVTPQRDERGGIRKIMLKSFNQYDVTNLALDIAELNISGPLAKLVELYPSRESQDEYSEARKLRRLIEATCKAIYTWHATRRFTGVRSENLEELYSVLRALFTLARDRDELRKLDEFVSERIEKSITLSDILREFSERMRVP